MPELMTIVFSTTTGLKVTVSYDMVAGIDDQRKITDDDFKDGSTLEILFNRAAQDICELLRSN